MSYMLDGWKWRDFGAVTSSAAVLGLGFLPLVLRIRYLWVIYLFVLGGVAGDLHPVAGRQRGEVSRSRIRAHIRLDCPDLECSGYRCAACHRYLGCSTLDVGDRLSGQRERCCLVANIPSPWRRVSKPAACRRRLTSPAISRPLDTLLGLPV
jgi:hypothetical protein